MDSELSLNERMVMAKEAETAAVNHFLAFVQNEQIWRRNIIAKMLDKPGRDLDAECGYPDSISVEQYHKMYDREPTAARVVELLPDESWAQDPWVYENDDTEQTPWEKAWAGIVSRHNVYHYLLRADIMSGIGEFGVLLLGFDDGGALDQPVPGMEDKLKEMFEAPPVDPTGANETETTDPKTGKPIKGAAPAPGMPPVPKPPAVSTTPAPTSSGPPAATTTPNPATSAGERTPGALPSTTPVPTTPPPNTSSPLPATTANPAAGVPIGDDGAVAVPTARLLYMRVFPQLLVAVTKYETDPTHWRYGQPTEYRIQFAQTAVERTATSQTSTAPADNESKTVHWTRIQHFADNCQSSEVLGTPRQKRFFNRLLDIRKISGSSGEMFYKGGFPGYSFEVDPNLEDVEMDRKAVIAEFEKFSNSLQRYMALSGVTAKSLAPQVSDPSPHIDMNLNLIAIGLGCPLRVFMGSEQAKLASSQDTKTWNGRVDKRRRRYVTPKIIRPFVDRLIAAGVLPEPAAGNDAYVVDWPELNVPSTEERADSASKWADAFSKYLAGGVEAIIPPLQFLTVICGLEQAEAEDIMEAARTFVEETDGEGTDQGWAKEPVTNPITGELMDPGDAGTGPAKKAPGGPPFGAGNAPPKGPAKAPGKAAPNKRPFPPR